MFPVAPLLQMIAEVLTGKVNSHVVKGERILCCEGVGYWNEPEPLEQDHLRSQQHLQHSMKRQNAADHHWK